MFNRSLIQSIKWLYQSRAPSLLVLCSVSSVMSNSLKPYGLWATKILCPWDSPGKNTGVSCHSLLQRIFPTQGLKLRLLCCLPCRLILYTLSYLGMFENLNWNFWMSFLNNLPWSSWVISTYNLIRVVRGKKDTEVTQHRKEILLCVCFHALWSVLSPPSRSSEPIHSKVNLITEF